ncbi:MAG: hypothetical protein HC785_31765 [Calothrix sp. CSU_2_0]|nr:hypothetical protein [Calothrix sp. CSU_2_0]
MNVNQFGQVNLGRLIWAGQFGQVNLGKQPFAPTVFSLELSSQLTFAAKNHPETKKINLKNKVANTNVG